MMRRVAAGAGRFLRDCRGVSAMEFAIVAPLMITIYFGLAELGDGLHAKRRVGHAAAAAGDLVAQKDKMADADRDAVFAAAEVIISPFPTSTLRLRITSITGNAKGLPRVDWSDATAATPTTLQAYAHCASVPDLPPGLVTAAGENVIMAEATYSYSSPIAQIIPDGLSFSEKFYLRPRKATKVPRDGALTTACTS